MCLCPVPPGSSPIGGAREAERRAGKDQGASLSRGHECRSTGWVYERVPVQADLAKANAEIEKLKVCLCL